MSGDDGRFDSARIVEALRSLARRIVVFDMDAVRARHRAAISAVIFGALAGSGAVPLSREACEAAIRDAGIGVAESLAAFAEAFACASEGAAPSNAPSAHTPEAAIPDRLARRLESMPRLVADIARSAVEQLVAYQDERYALWFVERTERVVKAAAGRGAGSGDVVRETVRRLALWMAYDDLIRVASLKSSASRFARIRSEVQARDGEIVRVRDFLRPGMSEIAAILPKRAGVWLERRILARAGSKPAGVSLTLHTSSVAGLLAMRALAAMRPLRPHSLRFAREQAAIEDWLALVERALAAHEDAFAEAALELSKLPRLLRGYGETHATGRAAFAERIDAYRNAGGAASASAVRALRQSTAAPSDCAPRRTANAHAAKAVRTQPVVWLDRR
jgi:indolepyruvate ferredoxin oxidoreductase beta subunit